MKTQILLSSIILIIFSTLNFAQYQLQHFYESDSDGDTDFGNSVSNAGDVNNDGYDDVIIGARAYNSYTGRAYIYFGGSSLNNTANVILSGENANDNFGYSVSGAGDVNNDGYDDVIVGASGYNYSTGRAYIYYGGSSMDNSADVIMTGQNINDSYGCSVDEAGDVNNDSYDDVIIGAKSWPSGDMIGRAYIYYGSNSMDNISDVSMYGPNLGCGFGISVSGVGDVNNDNYDDVIVGSFSMGQVNIYFGSVTMDNVCDVSLFPSPFTYSFGQSVSGIGDVNNDNYDDVIIGAPEQNYAHIYYGGNPMNTTVDVVLNGENATDNFGFSVSGAGDMNNDWYKDVIVGANLYDSQRGRVYVYYGGSTMDNNIDITLTGENTHDNFGCTVSGAGDLINSGNDEVIIGASLYSSNGKAYCYSLIMFFEIKIFLEGSYFNNEMTTILNSNYVLPLDQPFYSNPWYYDGSERLNFIPNDMVDWILLELRDKTNNSIRVSRKAAILKNDGWVMDIHGNTDIPFNVANDEYYLVVKHRNHLSVISSNPVPIN